MSRRTETDSVFSKTMSEISYEEALRRSIGFQVKDRDKEWLDAEEYRTGYPASHIGGNAVAELALELRRSGSYRTLVDFVDQAVWHGKGNSYALNISRFELAIVRDLIKSAQAHSGKTVTKALFAGCAFHRYRERIATRPLHPLTQAQGEVEYVGMIGLRADGRLDAIHQGTTLPLVDSSDLERWQKTIEMIQRVPWITYGRGGQYLQCSICHDAWLDPPEIEGIPQDVFTMGRAAWIRRHESTCRKKAMGK